MNAHIQYVELIALNNILILIQKTPQQINTHRGRVFGGQKDGEIRCEGSKGSDRQQGQICRYGYRINTHCHTYTHTSSNKHIQWIYDLAEMTFALSAQTGSEAYKGISKVVN